MTDDPVREESGSVQDPQWVGDVLTFWFGELDPQSWFRKSDVTDKLIRDRFRSLHARLAAEPPEAALLSPRRSLATVIVLDQFPRNMFRGTAQAFASDGAALEVARRGVGLGYDTSFDKHGRAFFYLPFEHSECLEDQERAVALFSALGDEEYARYALAHRDIIARFGRFPHRNAALGRASTCEEAEFLRQPGSSF